MSLGRVNRRQAGTFLLSVLAMANSAWAEELRISGQVENIGGRPVLDGSVVARSGVTVLAKEAIVAGRFSLRLKFTGAALSLNIVAPGFEPRAITVDVGGANLRLKPIKLKEVPGVSVGPMVHHRAPGVVQETLDVVLKNEHSTKEAHITSVSLAGTRRKLTDCLDLGTTGVMFELPKVFEANAKDGVVELKVQEGTGVAQRLSAQGRV